jgi:hypothetical protein
MFCGECGTQNPDINQFCNNCGRPLKRPQQAPAPEPAAGAVKPARNWTAIAALIISLGSWLLYPVILGFFAVVAGSAALWHANRKQEKIPLTAVLAILIGLAAIVINVFWLEIFPPPAVMPPVL